MYLLTIAVAVFWVLMLWCFYTRFKGAEYSPTTHKKAEKMMQFADIKKSDVVYDLGSGFGGLVLKASKKAKKAVGIEYDSLRYLISRTRGFGRKNAAFIHGDMFKENISDANIVFLFLKQKTNQLLKPKLSKLKKGTKIISNIWTFENWKPIKQDKKLEIYMYEIGKSN